jgi:heptosyltransferase-2
MKILVRGTNWIGDAVMSVPALRELRRIFPDSQITLHMRSWADGLFREAEFIDELVTYDKNRWAVKDVYDNSQFLRGDLYDLAVILPNSFESALTSFLTRIPRRFGYNKDVRGLLLTDPIAVPEWKNRRHEVFYYLNLVGEVERRILGRDTVSQAFPDISLEIPAERLTAVKTMLDGFGLDPAKKTVVLGVGSTNSMAKRWPPDHYARLADRLQTDGHANVVLIGSKDESPAAAQVSDLCKIPPVNIAGQTDLEEAAAILGTVDLLISNDMGLAHIAPAVGTQTIVIFGPTNPETTRPFSDNAEVILKGVECSPCMLRTCPIDHRCMEWISVDEVFDAAMEYLNPTPRDRVVEGDI